MPDTITPSAQVVEDERKNYLPYLLANPNYFGNLQNSPFKPVKKISYNTSYEELKCVGFNPQISRLEGVVWILRDSGYDGGLCTNGSLEYVSFYLSYDNGKTWLHQGTTNFRVYDVPGSHPLEYAVSLRIRPYQEFCFQNNLPLVRAILSWNTPPAGPSTVPVWGNVLETRIQIAPRALHVPFFELAKAGNLTIPPEISGLVAESATVELQAPKALSATELQTLYAKSDVPPHRFLHSTIEAQLANPESLEASNAFLVKLGVDVASVIAQAAQTNGNTSYEQLECIGLNSAGTAQDALVGTLQIKLPLGYSGGLCTAGSTEYVAFWLDWGGGVWEFAGTAYVKVHDIAVIPKEGLSYAVYLPVDLSKHRKACGAGPAEAKMRAILSWQTSPPPGNPNYVPVWGNRLETLILVDPGPTVPSGDYTPILQAICGVDVCDINQTTGFAPGDRPFGAAVSIYGYMPGAPKVNTPVANLPQYQITVQQVVGGVLVGAPQVITDPFGITIDQQLGGGLITSTNITQAATAGYFTYWDSTPDPVLGWRNISPPGLLGVWNSSADTGTYKIVVVAVDPVTHIPFPAGTTTCTLDGTIRQGVIIDLDQLPPVTSLSITGYKPKGAGPCLPAINCATFTVGDTICGEYSVSDEHFGSFSLSLEPFPGSFTVDGVAGSGESYPAVPTTGKSGVWTLDTTGLQPCGYTVQLSSSDRTIVSCVGPWENNSAFQGFCLVAAPKK